MYLVTLRPFYILGTNFIISSITLPKHISIEIGSDLVHWDGILRWTAILHGSIRWETIHKGRYRIFVQVKWIPHGPDEPTKTCHRRRPNQIVQGMTVLTDHMWNFLTLPSSHLGHSGLIFSLVRRPLGTKRHCKIPNRILIDKKAANPFYSIPGRPQSRYF